MAKDAANRQQHLRQLIAQRAASMMAEEGIGDYAYAKKKAGRQLGVLDVNCLPSNAEVEEEIKLYNEIFHGEEQPENLRLLRGGALEIMQLLERFNPHLTGPCGPSSVSVGTFLRSCPFLSAARLSLLVR